MQALSTTVPVADPEGIGLAKFTVIAGAAFKSTHAFNSSSATYAPAPSFPNVKSRSSRLVTLPLAAPLITPANATFSPKS